MLTAIIDCDVLVYASAFGAQKTRYDVTLPGSTAVLTFMDAKDRDEYLKVEGVDKKECEITPWLDVLPESAALSIARNNFEAILNELGTTEYQAYLTGEGNYREQVAVTKPYKGNRTQDKPVHYALVKDWYLNKVGAEVVDGMEADDMMGILATQDTHNVICTIDKDLNQVPGLHYDWNLGKKYKVNKADGDRFFIMQLLTGDTTDNIPGMKGMGWKGAEKLYKEASELTSALTTPAEYNWSFFESALALYEEKGYNKEYVEEQGQLLWIKRNKKEPLWTIEGFRKHLQE